MTDFGAIRALVIDDHDLQRRVVVRRLADLGVGTIDEAASGLAGISQLQSISYDLVLCDLDMPDLDGLGIVSQLIEAGSSTAIALMSSADPIVLECAELMCENQPLRLLGALEKPVTPKQLERLLADSQKPARFCPPVELLPLNEIRRGMAANEFAAYFQPIVDTESGVVRSVEALARWNHPQRGVLGPSHFLGELEQHDGLNALTWTMLQRTMELIKQLDAAGRAMTASINLSARFLARRGIADTLCERIADAGLSAMRIVFEVTESVALTTEPIAIENLARLRLRGHHLAADDFGTAYASLRQLVRVPFHKMKFDYSFLQEALHSKRAWAVLRAAIAMARDLRMETVLEGIESQEDHERMKSLGATSHQGFYYGRPMPSADLIRYLDNKR